MTFTGMNYYFFFSLPAPPTWRISDWLTDCTEKLHDANWDGTRARSESFLRAVLNGHHLLQSCKFLKRPGLPAISASDCDAKSGALWAYPKDRKVSYGIDDWSSVYLAMFHLKSVHNSYNPKVILTKSAFFKLVVWNSFDTFWYRWVSIPYLGIDTWY